MANEFTSPQDQLASLKAQLSAEHTKVAALELDSLKTRIAVEAGLPLSLKDRLQGDSEITLRHDAQELAQALRSNKPAPPLRSSERGQLEVDPIRKSFSKIIHDINHGEY